MKRKAIAPVLLLFVAASTAMYGCTPGTGTNSVPTTIPTPEATQPPSSSVVTCTGPRLLLAAGVMPTNTTQAGNTTLSYSDITAKLADYQQQINAASDSDQEAAWQSLDTYWNGLQGKQVGEWEGWVVRVGADTLDSMSGVDTATQEMSNEPRVALIAMQDPYATAEMPTGSPTTQPAATATPSFSRNDSTVSAPLIMVTLDQQQNVPLCVGQKVSFSGTISHAVSNYGRMSLAVPNAQVSVLEDKAAQYTTPVDLDGTSITLQRTPCFGSCPVYKATVLGNGFVVWEGQEFTKTNGFRFGHVDEAKLRQLISDFDKANFYSLTDYTHFTVSDMPSAITSIVLPSKSKTVHHYFGDKTAPDTLVQLEEEIDHVLSTQQWSGANS